MKIKALKNLPFSMVSSYRSINVITAKKSVSYIIQIQGKNEMFVKKL